MHSADSVKQGTLMNPSPTSSGGAVRRWRSMTAPRSATRRVRCPCCAKSYAPVALNGVPTAKPASECASSITGDSSPAPAAAPLCFLCFAVANQLSTLSGSQPSDQLTGEYAGTCLQALLHSLCAFTQRA